MLQGQPRWFNVIFSRQAEIVPIGMGYIWEVKGNSFQIFKSTPNIETPHRGRKAQRLTVVGSFSFPIESVRSHPNSCLLSGHSFNILQLYRERVDDGPGPRRTFQTHA